MRNAFCSGSSPRGPDSGIGSSRCSSTGEESEIYRQNLGELSDKLDASGVPEAGNLIERRHQPDTAACLMRSASLGDECGLDTFCHFYGFLIGRSREGLGIVDSFSLMHDSEGGDGDGLLQQLHEGNSIGALDGSAPHHLADERMLAVHAADDLAVAPVYRPG